MNSFILSTFTLIFAQIAFGQNPNPWESIGKPSTQILTLSDGRYPEIFENDTLRIIGSIVFNTRSNKIEYFIEQDTTYSESTLKPEVVSRWLSIDPLAKKYPFFSPYNFVGNNPIIFVDPDGKEIVIVGKVNGRTKRLTFEAGKSAPDGADDFTMQAFNSLNELYKSGSEKFKSEVDQLISMSTKIKVKHTDGDTKLKGNKTLLYNNNRGLLSSEFLDPDDPESSPEITNPNDSRRKISPRRIFKHELGHLINIWVRRTKDLNSNTDPTNAGYTNGEEESVINEYDNTDGKIRKSHGGISTNAKDESDENGELRIIQNPDGTMNKTDGDRNKVIFTDEK